MNQNEVLESIWSRLQLNVFFREPNLFLNWTLFRSICSHWMFSLSLCIYLLHINQKCISYASNNSKFTTHTNIHKYLTKKNTIITFEYILKFIINKHQTNFSSQYSRGQSSVKRIIVERFLSDFILNASLWLDSLASTLRMS